jgi:hypothetical protein
MQANPNRCIFCGNLAKLTSEHIWGDWIREYAAFSLNKHRAAHVAVPRPGAPRAPIIKPRAGDPLGSQVEVVCGDCNSGFLSRIQNRAKPYLIPLFEGQDHRLDEAAQNIIAAWIAMATMTSAYLMQDVTSEGQLAIPQGDRNWLMYTETAPRHWRIWIGQCHKWSRANQWHKEYLPIFIEPENASEGSARGTGLPNTQSTAFKIGKLYAFTLSSDFTRFVATWDWQRIYPAALFVLQEICPASAFIDWPYARMADKYAEGIAGSLRAHVDAISRGGGYNTAEGGPHMAIWELSIHCRKCSTALFRVSEPPSDKAYCPSCGAFGPYEEVAKECGDLVGGVLTQEELVTLRRKLGLPSK